MATNSPPSDYASQVSLSPAPNQFVQTASARTTFESFDQRLASFLNWPHQGRLSSKSLAAAGFYLERAGSDRVSCFCCDVALEDWNPDSDPTTEHQHASPACTWNNGTYMTTLDERLGSFHSWPIDIKPLPVVMAVAGFYHSNKQTDGVTCFSCKLALRDWKRTDDPIQQHLQYAPLDRPCSWIARVTNQPEPYIPPTPPLSPPMAATGAIPRECLVCQDILPSGNQLAKHARQLHGGISRIMKGRKIAVPRRRSGALLLGRHRVMKPVHTRVKAERRNTSGLFGRIG